MFTLTELQQLHKVVSAKVASLESFLHGAEMSEDNNTNDAEWNSLIAKAEREYHDLEAIHYKIHKLVHNLK